MEKLGKNVRKIRKKWGMDQATFAEFMETSKAMVSLYETGQNDPKIPFLVRICVLSNIDVHTMYDGEVLDRQIPKHPLQPGEEKIFSEPKIKYDQTTHELLSYPALVSTVRELLKRVAALEGDVNL